MQPVTETETPRDKSENDEELGTAGRLYLIDASGYIFRAYHALPALSRKSDGLPVGAVAGFCNMLWKLLDDFTEADAPTHIAAIFDAGSRTFRNDIYPDYKANRPPPPEDLIPQFGLVRQAVEAFGVCQVEKENFEADDLIATFARRAAAENFEVIIISSDKDLMQLVNGHISLLDTMKNRKLSFDAVKEKFGVEPNRVIDVQALAGDSVDNVPGVPGIGVKTAAQLIDEFGDLENLLAHAGEIKQKKRRENLLEFADQARISYELVKLDQQVDPDVMLDAMKAQPPQPDKLLSFLEEMEFRTLTQRVQKQFQAQGIEVSSSGGAGSAAQLAQMPPFDHKNYETVTTQTQLRTWIEQIRKTGYVTIDTETDHLHEVHANLVGISLAVTPGKACYIPITHSNPDAELGELDRAQAPAQLPLDWVSAQLKPVLEDPAILKIGQNIKYDWVVLAQACGIEMAPLDDTMLMSFCIDAGRDRHNMDALSEKLLDHRPLSYKELCGSGKNAITFDQVPLDKATHYAAEDADITLRLWQILQPELGRNQVRTIYETCERPLIEVLAKMEMQGILVDTNALAQLSVEFERQMQLHETRAHELAGEKFNLGSPKQIAPILFDKLGLPGGKKTKKGAWSTGADVLDKLATAGHELPQTLLAWRTVQKLRSTYTEALREAASKRCGRVHTSYSMIGAATGRLASNDPNLQNIPIRTEEGRKIREAFIAPKGRKLVSADYSQIELRVLAHMADIPSLKQAFDEGQDIHAKTASEMFGVPMEGMDPMIRRRAKAINFGIIYGISAWGLANNLGIEQKEAKAFIDTYFERFPQIKTYMEDTKSFARKHGYVQTLFGRKCHLPSMKSSNPAERAFGERAAINAPIQGSAADIIKRAMIRIPPELDDAAIDAKMLLQVHDELIFECADEHCDTLIALAKKVMSRAALPAVELSVPLIVDARAADNWAAAH